MIFPESEPSYGSLAEPLKVTDVPCATVELFVGEEIETVGAVLLIVRLTDAE